MARLRTSLYALTSLAVAFQPGAARAAVDVHMLGADEIFYRGLDAESQITGGANGEIIFGDTAAALGQPTALTVLTMGVDANGQPVPADSTGSNLNSTSAVSANGRKMVFESKSTNLVPGFNTDASGTDIQVYLKDLVTGTVVPVSTPDGTTKADDAAYTPVISPDGIRVAFITKAPNLVGQTQGAKQVVVKDMVTGALTVVSRNRVTGALGDGDSAATGFSPDGSRFAFSSFATNLVGGDTNGNYDVFVVDNLDFHTVTRVSVQPDGSQGTETSIRKYGSNAVAAFSPDGSKIAFRSYDDTLIEPTDLAAADILVKDLGAPTADGNFTGALIRASENAAGQQAVTSSSTTPAFSPDGREVVFRSNGAFTGDSNNVDDIFVKTLFHPNAAENGKIRIISVKKDGVTLVEADGASEWPKFTADGKSIAFLSAATNLAAGGASANNKLILANAAGTGDTALISIKPGGAEANAAVGIFSILPDGTGVLFDTDATNLVDGDSATSGDVFLAKFPVNPAASADVIDGGAGADKLFGAGGADGLIGGAGNDIVSGGDGDDVIFGYRPNAGVSTHDGGDDTLIGGDGDDTLVLAAPRIRSKITVNADGTFKVVDLASGSPGGTDLVQGVEKVDVVDGNGNLVVSYPLNAAIAASNNHAPTAATVSLTVKAGKASAAFAPAKDADGDKVTYAAVAGSAPKHGTLSFPSGKVVYTSTSTTAKADSFKVTASDPWGGTATVTVNVAIGVTLTGTAGNNTLAGGAGDDTLKGLGGNDRLSGADGNDLLDGGAGADRMTGGKGDDTYVVDRRTDTVVEKAGEGKDTVKSSVDYTLPANVEALILTGNKGIDGTGNGIANTLTGNAKANVLKGLGGNDVIEGKAGADRLDGGKGSDTTSYASSSRAVVVDLGEGRASGGDAKGDRFASIESLVGSRFDDRLTGNKSANVLTGGKGADVLKGGAGADRFVYLTVADSPPAKPDRIVDLTATGTARDRIDLAAIDADTTKPGNQAFGFIGAAAFSGKAGEARFASGVLSADTNGDKAADLSIKVTMKGGAFSDANLVK